MKAFIDDGYTASKMALQESGEPRMPSRTPTVCPPNPKRQTP